MNSVQLGNQNQSCGRHNTKAKYISLLMIAMLFISGCGIVNSQPTPTPIPLPGVQSASSSNSGNASKVQVEVGEIDTSVTYSGKVAVDDEEDLFFRRSGRVETVYIKNGDSVEEGTLIAELDTAILQIDLESAQLSVEIAKENMAQAEEGLLFDRRNAELNLEIAELALESYKERFTADPEQFGGSGYRPEETLKIQERQVEKSEIALARINDEIDPVVQLNLQRAELNLERVKQSLLDSKIRAPFDGEVRFISLPEDDRQIGVGEYDAVARMIKPDSLSVELNLSRTQLEPLAEGVAVAVRPLSRPDTIINGVIDALPSPFGRGVGPLTSISIVNDADRQMLIEGSTVDVDIQLGKKEDVLRIPVTALRGVPGNHYVNVSDASNQEETIEVEVGLQNDEYVEITSGLVEGQEILER